MYGVLSFVSPHKPLPTNLQKVYADWKRQGFLGPPDSIRVRHPALYPVADPWSGPGRSREPPVLRPTDYVRDTVLAHQIYSGGIKPLPEDCLLHAPRSRHGALCKVLCDHQNWGALYRGLPLVRPRDQEVVCGALRAHKRWDVLTRCELGTLAGPAMVSTMSAAGGGGGAITPHGQTARDAACAAAVAGDACIEVLALALAGAVRVPTLPWVVGKVSPYPSWDFSVEEWSASPVLWPADLDLSPGILFLQKLVVWNVVAHALSSGRVAPIGDACLARLLKAWSEWKENPRGAMDGPFLELLTSHCGPLAWYETHANTRRLLTAHLGILVRCTTPRTRWTPCPTCVPPPGSVCE